MAASLPLAAPAADAPVHATEATQAADAAFRAIYEKEWAWRASEFGFPADEDEKGDADMPRLPDVGPAAQQRRLAVWEDVLAQLETIDPAALSPAEQRSEEHTSELQSLMRISYAVFCLKKKTSNTTHMTMIE